MPTTAVFSSIRLTKLLYVSLSDSDAIGRRNSDPTRQAGRTMQGASISSYSLLHRFTQLHLQSAAISSSQKAQTSGRLLLQRSAASSSAENSRTSGLSLHWEDGLSIYRRLMKAAKVYPSRKRDSMIQDIRKEFRVGVVVNHLNTPYLFVTARSALQFKGI